MRAGRDRPDADRPDAVVVGNATPGARRCKTHVGPPRVAKSKKRRNVSSTPNVSRGKKFGVTDCKLDKRKINNKWATSLVNRSSRRAETEAIFPPAHYDTSIRLHSCIHSIDTKMPSRARGLTLGCRTCTCTQTQTHKPYGKDQERTLQVSTDCRPDGRDTPVSHNVSLTTYGLTMCNRRGAYGMPTCNRTHMHAIELYTGMAL